MREFLEDAHNHRNDGYGRAQRAEQKILPKRFYKQVAIVKENEGFFITLDNKPVKTPSKKPVFVPKEALALALQKEWQSQGEFIDTQSMPLTRLVNSGIEGGEGIEIELSKEIIKYAANDLLLYRADSPKKLVEMQENQWDSILLTLTKAYEVKFISTIGIIHVEQPQNSLDRLADLLEGLDKISLAALVSITSLSGSGLIAIAIFKNLITPDAGWSAAHVDEDFNDSFWGQDEEAIKRRNKRKTEFDAAVQLLDLLKS